MDLYLVIDSIRGTSDSIGVWKYPAYQETPVFEGQYIQVYDGFSDDNLKYYFYANDTVYFSIRAVGTPLLAGQYYDCSLNASAGVWSHGCSNLFRSWFQGNSTDCVVLEGETSVSNSDCSLALELEPGMNWVYNQGVDSNEDLNLNCWNNGEGGIADRGVWYTFTTPNVPVQLALETSSSNCDTVELSGVQIALFETCDDSIPLYCSSQGEENFGQLEFACGELPTNTTFYLLVDSYNGQEGIANLSYQLLYSCQDLGCIDPEACNFDPDAEIDDEGCLYGSDCDPEFTISVDTLDCLNYSLSADPFTFDPGSFYVWTVNGFETAPFTFGSYLFQPNAPGNYEICYYGPIDGFYTSTCIELNVDSACFVEPCSTEIVLNSDSAGCQLTVELFPTPPTNASYNWDFGNGLESTEGPVTNVLFEDSGVYGICVEVTSANCNNIQICDSIEIFDCPLSSPLEGCMDPSACNFDPEATESDGTCLYDEDCIPDFEFTIDTINCSNFDIHVSPYQVFLPGIWQVNGEENGNSEILDLNFNIPGVFEICYSGIISGLSEGSTCFQIVVDSACFLPCFNDVLIEIDSSGCTVDFEIPSLVPTSAAIGWQFGEGATIDWSNLPFASNTYENDGNYILAVIMQSIECENETVFIPLEISCSLDDIPGCTDLNALNFDPQANTDDGSCIYDANCLISFQIIPDSTDSGALLIIPSFDPLEALEINWTFGDGAASSDPFPTHEYSDEGPYTLCCSATFVTSDSLECTSEFCIDISGLLTENGEGPFSLKLPEPSSLSASKLGRTKSELRVWPNPIAEGNLRFRLENENTEIIDIGIYSSDGAELSNLEYISNQSVKSGSFSTEALTTGVYIFVVTTRHRTYRASFVVL